MKITFIFIIIFLFFSVRSQTTSPQVVASSGDFNSGISASLSWTLGEIVTETVSTGTNFLTQGFQQPIFANTLNLGSVKKNIFSVFPNPFTDQLFFRSNVSTESYSITITDFLGKEIFARRSLSFEFLDIPLSNLSAGVYNVFINTDTNSRFVFKMIKH